MSIAVNKKKASFYLVMGLVGVAAVIVGFFTTYVRPSFTGTFSAPVVVHIHGVFSFAWVILFVVQALVIRFRDFRLHKRLGYFGLFIAAGIITTLLPTGLFQVNMDLSKGMGDIAVSQIVGVVTTGLMFAILVASGFSFRKKPKVHKRLLLLATIVLLWPAWFRFRHYFPSVHRPDIWFGVVLADSLILFTWIADWVNYKKVHPVFLYGGLLIIAEHAFEVLTFDNDLWRIVARALYGALM